MLVTKICIVVCQFHDKEMYIIKKNSCIALVMSLKSLTISAKNTETSKENKHF